MVGWGKHQGCFFPAQKNIKVFLASIWRIPASFDVFVSQVIPEKKTPGHHWKCLVGTFTSDITYPTNTKPSRKGVTSPNTIWDESYVSVRLRASAVEPNAKENSKSSQPFLIAEETCFKSQGHRPYRHLHLPTRPEPWCIEDRRCQSCLKRSNNGGLETWLSWERDDS